VGWQAATVNLLKCVLALAFQSSERCAVRALAGGGPTLDRKLFAPCQRMLQQSTDKERYSKPSRQQPERNLRKLSPQGQVLTIVDVECRQHQNVGQTHTDDVQPDTIAPTLTHCCPRNGGCNQGQHAENEQVVVLGPTDYRKRGCRSDDYHQAPVI